MDIVTRLKEFLGQNGISNSQFADTCEIPRPTLSQLLNGRNKRVSDEVIGKIHRAYPSLNIMWLMFGDGEMLLNGSSMDGGGMPSASPMADEHGQRAISFDDADANPQSSGGYNALSTPRRVATADTVSETIQNIVRSSTAGGRMNQRGNSMGEGRRVVNLMVFYNDGTFEQFGPSR